MKVWLKMLICMLFLLLSLSHVQLFGTLWTAACQASQSFKNSWSLLKLMSIESMMPPSHLILCHALLFLPSIFSSIRVFSSELALLNRWPKYWSFRFSISPSNDIQDWFPLGLTGLVSLQSKGLSAKVFLAPQFKSINSQCSAFFMVQLSYLYITTGKIIALTIQTSVHKVVSLLFNKLSRLVIAFLPKRRKSFNFVDSDTIYSDFRAQENKICHCFHCLLIYLPWSDRTGCHDLSFLNVQF